MTQWAHSLIRISNYEVETLQKRLAEITPRRVSAEMRLTVLEAEAELERERARADHEAGMMLIAYLKGWNLRREEAAAELAVIDREQDGARDALTAAVEALK